MNVSIVHLVILYSFTVVLCAICIYLLYMVITLQSQWNIFQDFFQSQMFTDEFYAVLDTYFINYAQRTATESSVTEGKTSTLSSATKSTTTKKIKPTKETEKTIVLQVDTSIPIQVQTLDLLNKHSKSQKTSAQKDQGSCSPESENSGAVHSPH